VGQKVEQTERSAPGADGLGMDRAGARGECLGGFGARGTPDPAVPAAVTVRFSISGSPDQHRLGLNAFFPTRVAVAPVGGKLGSQDHDCEDGRGDGKTSHSNSNWRCWPPAPQVISRNSEDLGKGCVVGWIRRGDRRSSGINRPDLRGIGRHPHDGARSIPV
jgi:hypothetical protein